MHINKPVKNYYVGQNGDDDKNEVCLPDDGADHYQEKSYIT